MFPKFLFRRSQRIARRESVSSFNTAYARALAIRQASSLS